MIPIAQILVEFAVAMRGVLSLPSDLKFPYVRTDLFFNRGSRPSKMPQVIYVLNQEVAFELVAQILIQTDLQLTDVASCTFPSRPEPKSALWVGKQTQKVIGYTYLPDIELRYLRLLDLSWIGFQPHGTTPISTLLAEQNSLDLFSSWDELSDDLRSKNHRRVTRAAWAMRAAAKHGDSTVDGQARLVEALAGDDNTRRVVADALADIATNDYEETLRRHLESDPNPDVRMHLRRAIDHIMSTL